MAQIKVINAQNWPRDKKIRRFILPYSPDHVIVECDQSQAEARIVAWKANETRLIDLFLTGKKVHEVVGSSVMQEPVSKKLNPVKYETSKRIVHGSNYGMKPPTLSEVVLNETGIAVPIHECRKRQNVYFQQYPRIKTGYHMALQEELRRCNKTITTCTGDVRKFYASDGDELYRQVYAYYAQNPVAYITNRAMIILQDSWLRELLMMQMHDALIYSVPKERLAEGIRMIQQAMTYTLVINKRPLTIPVDTKVGPNWGEMGDYTP